MLSFRGFLSGVGFIFLFTVSGAALADDAEPVPNNISARYGLQPAAPHNASETDKFRQYIRAYTSRRFRRSAVQFLTGALEDTGKQHFGDNFRASSSLLWGSNGKLTGSLTLIAPLRERTGEATFLQSGFVIWQAREIDGRADRRTDFSLGVVHRRHISGGGIFGGSLFYDRGRYGHHRGGAGIDYQYGRTRFSGNYYLPLTDSRTGFAGRREYALQGLDFNLEQDLGHRLSFLATAGIWEATAKGIERVGRAHNTFGTRLHYGLNRHLSLRGGYEWSEDQLNIKEGYNFGLEFQLPAGAESAENEGSTASESDLWLAVRREARIFVARDNSPSRVRLVVRSLPNEVSEGEADASFTLTTDKPPGIEKSAAQIRMTVRNLGGATATGDSGNNVSLIVRDTGEHSDTDILFSGIADGSDVVKTFTLPAVANAVSSPVLNIEIRTPHENFGGGRQKIDMIFELVDGVSAGYVAGTNTSNNIYDTGQVLRRSFTFVDNDAGLVLSQTSAEESFVEGVAHEVMVRLTKSLGEVVPFTLSIYDGDTELASLQDALAASQTSRIVDFTVPSDMVLRSGVHQFTLRVEERGTPNPLLVGKRDELSVNVIDSDRSAAQIAFGETASSITPHILFVDENVRDGVLHLPATISHAPEEAVTFDVGVLSGTTASADDYSIDVSSITYGPEDPSLTKNLAISLHDDDHFEEDEMISLRIMPPTSESSNLLSHHYNRHTQGSTAQITIVSDDTHVIGFSSGAAIHNETDVVTALTLTVGIVPRLKSPSRVNVRVIPRSATASDYTAPAEFLELPAETDSVTLTIPITGDNIDETDETFTVALSAIEGAHYALATDSVEVTIRDDEVAPSLSTRGLVRVVEEGDAAAFTIVLDGTSQSPVTGAYTVIPGTATSADYDDSGGAFTIPAGQTSAGFTILITEDEINEIDETFSVQITLDNANLVSSGHLINETITIRDDDAIPTLSFSSAAVRVDEGDDAAIAVVLSGGSSRAVSGTYTLSDGTAAVDDYTNPSARAFIIPAGDTRATFTISTTEDAIAEADETFTATISSDSLLLATLGSSAAATITIVDDEATPALSLESATYEVDEGDDATVAVVLSGESSRAVSGVYTLSGGTAAADDYTNPSTRAFTIPAGDTRATFTASTTEDAIAEVDETFTLTIATDGSPHVTLGSQQTATITIKDDEATPTLSLESAVHEIDEGDDIAIAVVLSGADSRAVRGRYTLNDGTAGADDYDNSDGAFSIPVGQTRATLTIPTTEDSIAEALETFTLAITTDDSPFVTLGSPHTATITIKDDEAIPTLSLQSASLQASEGNDVTIGVILSGESSRAVSGTYTLSDGTAGADDYTTPSERTFAIPAEQTGATLVISTTEDTIAEPAETFTLAISADDASIATVGSPHTATITINDDEPIPMVGVPQQVSVEEGDSASIGVVMSGESSRAVSGTYTTTPNTATAADYTVTGGTFAIPVGQIGTTLSINTTEDTAREANETFTVTIALADGSAVNLSDAFVTTVTINDDEADDKQPSFSQVIDNLTYTKDTTITAKQFPVAEGGDGALAYTLTPEVPGLDFDKDTRLISGTPTAAGTYTMTYAATDSDAQNPDTATLGFTIVVNPITGVLTYTGDEFTESGANNGAVEGSIVITLSGDALFADPLTPTFGNIPSLMEARLSRDSDTQATLTLGGRASSHRAVDGVGNVSIIFDDDDFSNTDAVYITRLSRGDLRVTFMDPPATLILGNIASVLESGTLMVPLSLSRDIAADATATITLTHDPDGDGVALAKTETADVVFTAADDATSPKVVDFALSTLSALGIDDDLVNLPKKLTVTAVFKDGTFKEGEANDSSNPSVDVTITDDEVPVIVFGSDLDRVEALTSTVREDVGDVVIPLTLSHLPEKPLSFTISNSSSIVGGDSSYTINPRTVTFADAGDTAKSKNITVRINDDDIVEAPRTITLTIDTPGDGLAMRYGRGGAAYVLTINSDDTAAFAVRADKEGTIPGGESLSFTATLTASAGIVVGSGGSLVFVHEFADATPDLRLTFTDTTGPDGAGEPDGLLSAAAELTATSNLWKASGDESRLSFVLTSNPPADLTAAQFTGLPGVVDVVVKPTLSITTGAVQVAEGSAYTITITSSDTAPISGLTIPLKTQVDNNSKVTVEEKQPGITQVVIASGKKTASIEETVTDDATLLGDYELTFTLDEESAQWPSDYVALPNSEAVSFTVVDDEIATLFVKTAEENVIVGDDFVLISRLNVSADEGRIKVGSTGWLRFVHFFSSPADPIPLLFIDTTGEDGNGSPDGYLSTAEELKYIYDPSSPIGSGSERLSFDLLELVGGLKSRQFPNLPVVLEFETYQAVSITTPKTTLTEGDPVRVQVTVSHPFDAATEIPLSIAFSAGYPLRGKSAGILSEVVTLRAGERSAELVLPITGDDFIEGDGQFTVKLDASNAKWPTGYLPRTLKKSITFTINDDDKTTLTVSPSHRLAFIDETLRLEAELSPGVTLAGGTSPHCDVIDASGCSIEKEVADVGIGGSLTFTDASNNLSLTFTDTAGRGGQGRPDGVLSGDERRATIDWEVPGGISGVFFSFDFTNSSVSRLTRSQFTGLPATVSVSIRSSVELSLETIASRTLDEAPGTDIVGFIVASGTIGDGSVDIPIRVVDIGHSGEELRAHTISVGGRFTEGNKRRPFGVMSTNDYVSGTRQVRIILGDALPRGYVADSSKDSLDFMVSDDDTASLTITPSATDLFVNDEFTVTGVLFSTEGGIWVGDGGSLAFFHEVGDVRDRMILTFTDTTGPDGTGAPDGFITTLSERTARLSARFSTASVVNFSFNLLGALPARLSADRFKGLPATATVVVNSIVTLSLSIDDSATFLEGGVMKATVSASGLLRPSDAVIDFHLIEVDDNGVEGNIRRVRARVRFTKAVKGSPFNVLTESDIYIRTSRDGIVRGARALKLRFGDSLPSGYVSDLSKSSVDLSLNDADAASLSIVLSKREIVFRDRVPIIGTLSAGSGGIFVTAGGTLTFVNSFGDPKSRLTLTFTDTTGRLGNPDGYLRGNELIATTDPWDARFGAIDFSFDLSGSLPGRLTRSQFTSLPATKSIIIAPPSSQVRR